MTEIEANAAELAWGEHESHNKVLDTLRLLKRPLVELRQIQDEHNLSESEALVVLATLISEDPATDLTLRRFACYHLARDCQNHQEPFFAHLKQASYFQLIELKQSRLAPEVEIMGCDNACPACQDLIGRIYTIDQALEQMPLPCANCTTSTFHGLPGYCRCSWAVAV